MYGYMARLNSISHRASPNLGNRINYHFSCQLQPLSSALLSDDVLVKPTLQTLWTLIRLLWEEQSDQ